LSRANSDQKDTAEKLPPEASTKMQYKSFKMGASFEQSQSIIQCPQCQTKFAVETNLLADLIDPRFHCSRCDFIFSFELKQLTPPPPSRSQAFSILEPRVEAANAASAMPLPAPATSTAPAWTMGLPTADRPASRGLEIPRPIEVSKRSSAPHESGTEAIDATQMKFEFKRPAEFEKPFTISSFDQPVPLISQPAKSEVRVSGPTTSASFEMQAPSTRWSGLIFAIVPMLTFMCLVIGFSVYLRSDSDRAEKLFAAFTKAVPQVAPPQLSVENAKFKRIPLDSGETAYLVSGIIKNESQTTFKEVRLEGVGFDASGEMVARTQVDAGAQLAKTRIRSLSTDMIRNLQSGQLKNKIELKPGQSEEFTFAMLDGEISKARFFSTRIYSVAY
jgi:hypothetical protein